MIDPKQLLYDVIRPVTKTLPAWSVNAERLLLGTACKESDCGRFLRQLGGGPALGIWQMEPATYQDTWANFLYARTELAHSVLAWSTSEWPDVPEPKELIWNLAFACAMARIKYLRVPEPIPDTLPGQAGYWKKYYNTIHGAGTVEGYVASWRRLVGTNLE